MVKPRLMPVNHAPRLTKRLFGRRFSSPQPARLVRLRARLRCIHPKTRKPDQRRGSKPKEAGAAHAEFSRAPVDGGRLILPMTSDQGFGAKSLERVASSGTVFRIKRRGHDYFAHWISPVAIFPCAGSRDEVSERALAEAFAKGGWQKVTRLYRDQEIPQERCWLRGPRWCFATS
jgi:hypothetical protein